MSQKTKHFYEFGGYRIDLANRLLWRGSEVVALPPKAFDILLALVEESGQVLTKDELMQRVWRDTFVEEANLPNHISNLRKVLGEDKNGAHYIETIPRRGYRFVAAVTEIQGEPAAVLVEERTHTRIVIEEVQNGDAHKGAVDSPPLDWQKQIHLTATSATSLAYGLARRQIITVLIVVGLLLAGTAAYRLYFSGRNTFKDKQEIAPNGLQAGADSKMKITRLTSFGKGITTISPDGRFICYCQNYVDGLGTLWLQQVATNKEIQLLESGERVFSGNAFSPDGQFIYYAACNRGDSQGALFRVSVLGGPSTRLIDNFASMFTLSPDGQRVTFYRYSADVKKVSLMTAALDGTNEQTLLTFNYPEQSFNGSPCWSPDGKHIAFAATTVTEKSGANGNLSLFVIDITSTEVKPLTAELWREVGRMAWSYDGQTLFFVARRPHIGNQLYELDYATGAIHRLTSAVQGYGNYGLGITADGNTLVADGWESSFQLWSVGADGKVGSANRLTTGLDDGSSGIALFTDNRIAYVSRMADNLDLWTMKPDGTDAKPLTADAFEERDVTASVDGRYLVFASNRAGGNHLFRMDADGSNLRQLTFGDGFDVTPDCSPDGGWIVYASRSGDRSTIWKVPLEGGTPIQLTDYHAIKPNFSPDGKLLSCILPSRRWVEKGSLAIIAASGGMPFKTFPVVQFAHNYVTPRWTHDGQAVVYTETRNSVGNLWKQPLAGGKPEQLTDFKTDLISNFAYSRDGKRIILARGPKGGYAILIRDFQ